MKVAVISDLHFGVKKSDKVFQESQLRFFEKQFVPELKEKEIETVIICGDVFDTRQTVNTQTNNVVLNLFKNTLKDFEIHIIVGNHDIYYTTTTEVNSLKFLSLLGNIKIYEKPTSITLDGEDVCMMPWVTNYEDFETINIKKSKYCFAHLDIIGFEMNKGQLSQEGITIKQVLKHFKYTYSGHYHCPSVKKYESNTIAYVGAPYQVTRVDSGQERGYGILDLKTNNYEFVPNRQSMIFTEHIYPDVNMDIIEGNVVDLKIPPEFHEDTKKIYNIIQKMNNKNPAYPVNLININPDHTEANVLNMDLDAFNLENLFKNYVEQDDTIEDKNKILRELVNLYEMFKGVK